MQYIKRSQVKGKYTINKNIKKIINIQMWDKKYWIDIDHLNIIA